MVTFIHSKYFEIVLIYDKCQQNVEHNTQEYADRFPAVPLSSTLTVVSVLRQLMGTESTDSHSLSDKPVGASLDVMAGDILVYAIDYSQISTSDIGKACGLIWVRV